MNTVVFLSESHNPWFNLATEDWLFHQATLDQQILFLWRNQPSVVIGRAQNPWAECNLNNMARDGILLARRQSGGGTVFHDLGNTNFTFISPLSHYDKNTNLQLVLQALKKLGISAYASPRNDLLIEHRGHAHKISGSAFRQTKDKAFHHGTLLINANLLQLNDYLQPKPLALVAKGVSSVRSTVLNLTELSPTLHHDPLCEALTAGFFQYYGQTGIIETLAESKLNQIETLAQRYQEYQSWEWRFGKTLPFELTLSEQFSWGACTVTLHCIDAKIDQVSIQCDALSTTTKIALKQILQGQSCHLSSLSSTFSTLTYLEQGHELHELIQWLWHHFPV